MSKKSRTKPKKLSGIQQVDLEFVHPVEGLKWYIGPFRLCLATKAKELWKCGSDVDKLRVLREGAKWALHQLEMADVSAKGISRWFQYGMLDDAGPFEARLRELLLRLKNIFRTPDEFVERRDTCAILQQCHDDIAAANRKLEATPLDPDDDAKLMWSVNFAVFRLRLIEVSDGLGSLASLAGSSSADAIADSHTQVKARIDALEDVFGAMRVVLTNALYRHDYFRWPMKMLPVHLRLIALRLAEGDRPPLEIARDAVRHVRHIQDVLSVSKTPAMSPEAIARMWAKFPSDAKAMELLRPTTRETTRTVEPDATSETANEVPASKPPDPVAITSTQAIDIVNKGRDDVKLTEKTWRRWFTKQDIKVYTRDQWSVTFGTKPGSPGEGIKGNPALIESSSLMRVLKPSGRRTEREMDQVGRMIEKIREKKSP